MPKKPKVHAKLRGYPETFCGRFYKDVSEYLEFYNHKPITDQIGGDQVTCQACWNMTP